MHGDRRRTIPLSNNWVQTTRAPRVDHACLIIGSGSGYPDQPASARVDSILWLRQRQVDRSFLLEQWRAATSLADQHEHILRDFLHEATNTEEELHSMHRMPRTVAASSSLFRWIL